MKIGIDVRFHKSPDRDRKRLITITASSPDAAIKEEAISPSAASTKPASGHYESHDDAGGDEHATAISSTTPDPPTVSEPRAQTADAADAGEIEKSTSSKTTPPNRGPHKLRTLRRLKSRTRASKSFPIGCPQQTNTDFTTPDARQGQRAETVQTIRVKTCAAHERVHGLARASSPPDAWPPTSCCFSERQQDSCLTGSNINASHRIRQRPTLNSRPRERTLAREMIFRNKLQKRNL